MRDGNDYFVRYKRKGWVDVNMVNKTEHSTMIGLPIRSEILELSVKLGIIGVKKLIQGIRVQLE